MNIYVALLRSSGQDTLRHLWDFDPMILMKRHSPKLLQEDGRLEKLNEVTLKWCQKEMKSRASDHECDKNMMIK